MPAYKAAVDKGYLRRIAATLLREAEEEEKEPGEDSLDAQIDKYLASYEGEAKNLQKEGRDFRALTRRFLIEAGEDEDEAGAKEDAPPEEESGDKPEAEGGEEAAGDEGEDAEEGGEEGAGEEEGEEKEPEEPKKMTIDEINIKSFVSDVMRLVENHESLLETRNTILRRASNFLLKSYEKDVVDSFKEELLESFGVEIGTTDAEKQDDQRFQPPKAGFAGPLGGGT